MSRRFSIMRSPDEYSLVVEAAYPVKVPMTRMTRDSEVIVELSREVKTHVRETCGRLACDPRVSLGRSRGIGGNSDEVIVSGGTMTCDEANCPMDPGSGGAGDREQRIPPRPSSSGAIKLPLTSVI